MFIDILNIANKTFTGISFGLGGSLLGTFLLSDLKKRFTMIRCYILVLLIKGLFMDFLLDFL